MIIKNEQRTNPKRGTQVLQFDEAVTIDEVIHQLESLVASCIESNSRIGYFASLYHKVTLKVKEGILKMSLRMEFEWRSST
jgi:Family of unknown function (DUF5995)